MYAVIRWDELKSNARNTEFVRLHTSYFTVTRQFPESNVQFVRKKCKNNRSHHMFYLPKLSNNTEIKQLLANAC